MKFLSTVIFSSCTLCCYAQNNDSLPITILMGKQDNNFHKFFIPSALIASGTLSQIHFRGSLNAEVYKERTNNIPNFKTSVDNYLQFSPIILAYGFDALGMKSKTDIINRSVILLKSEIIMSGSVTILKYTIREQRPDKSANNSVPSGHTAQAFAAAAFLSEEFGAKYKWVPYLSYSLASSVGVLRIMNNKHYLSDVLIGAGIGILSTKISYWTHQYKWGKRKKLSHFKAGKT